MMEITQMVLALIAGVGLAAACGFRVFVPLLVLSLAARTGSLPLASNMQWVASDTAIVIFAAATVLEILAFYVPWVDNMLDTVATPAAAVAGSLAAASVFTQFDPVLQWTIGIIAGGGVATTVQLSTVAARAGSTLTTGGMANFLVASAEDGLSLGVALLAVLVILMPVLGIALLVLFGVAIFRIVRRRRHRHHEAHYLSTSTHPERVMP